MPAIPRFTILNAEAIYAYLFEGPSDGHPIVIFHELPWSRSPSATACA
jgi:hypothetical protein